MAHSYPVWVDIHSCAYRSNKSYGIKRDGNQEVKIGTSAKNSHYFFNQRITVRELPDGGKCFRLYIDGILVKEATIKNGVKKEVFSYLDEKK